LSNYNELYIPGKTYFLTLVTHDRQPILTTESGQTCLQKAWKQQQLVRPFETVALCILPDHLHSIITLDDADVETRIEKIKAAFAKSYLKTQGIAHSIEHPIWQNRFWQHRIRGQRDFSDHLDYLHYNPVRHGLVDQCKEWPYSTFHKFVHNGWYDEDWGEIELELFSKLKFGE